MKHAMWNFISVDTGSKTGCKWNIKFCIRSLRPTLMLVRSEEPSSEVVDWFCNPLLDPLVLLTDTSHGQLLGGIWFSRETKEPLRELCT
jgi:hypothetical protein